MKDSTSFNEYQDITEKLKNFNLDILDTKEKKLSFWINIYNSLVVHGITQLNVKDTVREISGFFEYVTYNIGGYYFSLNQIEHGILRGNIKKHILASRPFSSTDERNKFVIKEFQSKNTFLFSMWFNLMSTNRNISRRKN